MPGGQVSNVSSLLKGKDETPYNDDRLKSVLRSVVQHLPAAVVLDPYASQIEIEVLKLSVMPYRPMSALPRYLPTASRGFQAAWRLSVHYTRPKLDLVSIPLWHPGSASIVEDLKSVEILVVTSAKPLRK